MSALVVCDKVFIQHPIRLFSHLSTQRTLNFCFHCDVSYTISLLIFFQNLVTHLDLLFHNHFSFFLFPIRLSHWLLTIHAIMKLPSHLRPHVTFQLSGNWSSFRPCFLLCVRPQTHPGVLSLEYGTEDHILGAARRKCEYIKNNKQLFSSPFEIKQINVYIRHCITHQSRIKCYCVF